MSRFAVHFAFVPALFTVAACATAPAPQLPASDALRASLGSVGVLSAPARQSFVFDDKTFFDGAVQGLRDVTAAVSYVDAHRRSYSPYVGGALLLALPIVPIVEGVNAVTGGLSSSEKRKLEPVFRELLPPGEVQRKLREEIVVVARDSSGRNLPEAESNAGFDSASEPEVSARQKMDTVLEVTFLPAAISGSDEADPVIHVAFAARARLLRGSDRTVLWEYHADAPSKALDMNLSVLTSVAAKELRLEVDQAIGALARDIVLQAFGDIATMPPASSEPSLTITDAGDNEAEHK